MRTSTPLRTFAAVALTGLVVAACGQKPNVAHIGNGVDGGTGTTTLGAPADTSGGTGTNDTGGGGATTTDTSSGGGTTTPTPGGATATDGGGATTTDGGTGQTQQPADNGGQNQQPADNGGQNQQPADNGGQNQQPTGTAQPTGTDTTGVTDDAITVAVHAPATGAAPLPTTSFEKARDTYWRWIFEEKGETVLGRSKVNVEYRDDKYRPEEAIQVCKELASTSFLLVGGGGTDQIKACGQLAEAQSFPYFSAGVTEAGLDGNPWYFAASMSYRQQGGLLAQYIRANPHGVEELGANAKIGVIITDTPNFDDAEAGFKQGLVDNGMQAVEFYRHPKGDTSWYADTAKRFRDKGINTIYILSSPVDYINFSNTATNQFSYNPQYVGVGISKALNAVLASGCGDPDEGLDRGIFLHPYQGLDEAEPEFFTASQKFDAPADDIAYALWGLAKAQRQLFDRYGEIYGNNLTREDFRAVTEGGAGVIETGVYPALDYTNRGHFGADSAHVLQADCSKKQHITLQQFATGF